MKEVHLYHLSTTDSVTTISVTIGVTISATTTTTTIAITSDPVSIDDHL